MLLHLLATAEHPQLDFVATVHVDHNLQDDSKKWAQHCADVCLALNVEHHNLQIEVDNIETLGMEAAARSARYRAIEQLLPPGDVLLTAQHQHDQAETLLLQLLRGAGPKGLSSMAKKSSMGNMELIRPLLDISQAEILHYAQQFGLKWIEDPSNVETRWSRNYLRHNVWPIIEQRWPQAATTLSRTAQHCAEASELLVDLASQDMKLLDIDVDSGSLTISALMTLSPARQRNLLRHYIELRLFALPSTTVLQCIIDEVCLAAQDKEPLVSWAGVEARRFQDQLYLMTSLPQHGVLESIMLNDTANVALQNDQVLVWQQTVGKGLSEAVIENKLRLAFRQGGERIQLQGHQHHQSVKHLFQQWHIPPWQRDRIPLLFCDDKLIAIVGYGMSNEYAVSAGQQGYLPVLKTTN